MNKIVPSLKEAVADIPNGATILIGGFGGCGNPNNLINALVEQGAKELELICDDWSEWESVVKNGQVKTLIAGFTYHPFRPKIGALVLEQMQAGTLKRAETVPHGTLEERIRAGGMGIPAFYTPVGAGTVVEQGKEKRVFDGRECILERAITADYALVKGYKADRFGNVICRLSAGNRNVIMATAARTTVVEVEEVVEVGELDPQAIHIPGVFVHRVVKVPKIVIWQKAHEEL